MTLIQHAMRVVVACAGAIAVAHADALAQVIPAEPMTAAECRAAASTIGPTDPSGASWSRVSQCGSVGGTALANALDPARTATDSLYLRSLLAAGSRIRDPNLFAIALGIANDRAASDAPRIIAILIALQQLDNHNDLAMGLSWSQTVTDPWGPSCRQLVREHEGAQYNSETALPENAAVQLGARLDSVIFAAPPNSPAVTDVAKCVRVQLSGAAPDAVDPMSITLSYVCGNTFRVTNASPKWIDVGYAVVNSNETGNLEVAPNSSRNFEVDVKGAVALTYLGQVIRQTANGGAVCPP